MQAVRPQERTLPRHEDTFQLTGLLFFCFSQQSNAAGVLSPSQRIPWSEISLWKKTGFLFFLLKASREGKRCILVGPGERGGFILNRTLREGPQDRPSPALEMGSLTWGAPLSLFFPDSVHPSFCLPLPLPKAGTVQTHEAVGVVGLLGARLPPNAEVLQLWPPPFASF